MFFQAPGGGDGGGGVVEVQGVGGAVQKIINCKQKDLEWSGILKISNGFSIISVRFWFLA